MSRLDLNLQSQLINTLNHTVAHWEVVLDAETDGSLRPECLFFGAANDRATPFSTLTAMPGCHALPDQLLKVICCFRSLGLCPVLLAPRVPSPAPSASDCFSAKMTGSPGAHDLCTVSRAITPALTVPQAVCEERNEACRVPATLMRVKQRQLHTIR